jgi:hypothetical protein
VILSSEVSYSLRGTKELYSLEDRERRNAASWLRMVLVWRWWWSGKWLSREMISMFVSTATFQIPAFFNHTAIPNTVPSTYFFQFFHTLKCGSQLPAWNVSELISGGDGGVNSSMT